MTGYLRFITVPIFVATCTALIFAQQETVAELRAKADQGDAVAQYSLGVIYRDGVGVAQNYAVAVQWHRLAADQGYAPAQYNLGVMYFQGEGLPMDDVAAYMWFSLAATRATGPVRDSAIGAREQTAGYLTSEQLLEAQRLVFEWDAAHPFPSVSPSSLNRPPLGVRPP